jgi:periplasmic protein TonB
MIPEVSRFKIAQRKDRQEIGISFLIALLIHALILLIFLSAFLGKPSLLAPITPVIPEQPMEITILPPPPPPAPIYVDTTTSIAADNPVETSRFESDRDTKAASKTVGKGASDLPSQEGRKEDYLELTDQQAALGVLPQPSAPSPPAQATEAVTPPKETHPQKNKESKEQNPAQKEKKYEKKETPSKHAPELLALKSPTDVQRATPVIPPNVQQQVRKAESATPPTPARPPGYQPERRVTRIEGGVSNQGPSSVAAKATPLGRYKKALSDAIGSRWYFYVRNEIGVLAVGTTTIRFQVLTSGKVTSIQVLTNSSNESFASVSIRSIMEAEIPKIPPEVAELLENNRIEVDYTFSILAN